MNGWPIAMRRRSSIRIAASLFIALQALATGCVEHTAEQFGKTFYLDGAGNWGFGASEVPEGLKEAGYEGDVELYVWTTSLVPLVDQLNIVAAKAKAAALSRRLTDYKRRFPEKPLHVIALSAGTGVATWAIEGMKDGAKVNNLVLLGSSLSHDYDMTRALGNMEGKIYAYYSPHDTVLETVRVVGTIDGKRGVDSIGLVGLTPPPDMEDRVVNIGWDRSWMRLGWAGAHTDTTNQLFVRYEISTRIVKPSNEPPTGGDSVTSAGALLGGLDRLTASRQLAAR
jgi:hypothetical protein